MKLFFTLLSFLLITNFLFSQKEITATIDANWSKTKNEKLIAYTISAYKENGMYKAEVFDLKGKKYADCFFTNKELTIKHGPVTLYYTKTAKPMAVFNMQYGFLHGPYVSYYTSGTIQDSGAYYYNYPVKRWKSNYENGQLYFNAKYADSFSTPTAIFTRFKETQKAAVINDFLNKYYDPIVPAGLWETYYANGKKRDSVFYIQGIKTGFAKCWYENGNLTAEGEYSNGIMAKQWKWFHENGNKATEEFYDAGSVKELKCYDSTGTYTGELCGIQRDVYYKQGDNMLDQFLNKNLWKPLDSILPIKDIYVQIKLKIDESGKASLLNIQPASLLIYEQYISEAIKKMGLWEPAISHNRIIATTYAINQYYNAEKGERYPKYNDNEGFQIPSTPYIPYYSIIRDW